MSEGAMTEGAMAGDTRATEAAPYLVWRRDTTRTSRRWLKWAALALFALCGFGAFAGYMAEDLDSSITIVTLGLIALALMALIPWIWDVNKRRHPEVVLIGRDLVWAKKRVPIDAVDRFTTAIQHGSFHNGTTTVFYSVGGATFIMNDGSKVGFRWPSLNQPELDALSARLDQILPGRRQAL